MSKSKFNRSTTNTKSSGTDLEFPITDEIKRFKITRIYVKGRRLFVDNSRAQPIICPWTRDLETTSNALEQALIHANEPDLNEQARTKILMFLADEWHRQAEEGLTEWSEDIEEEDKKKLYVQKYSTGIPLAESILIDGTAAMFLQIIDGKAILSREILLPGNISLRPWDKWSYLNKEYSFSSLEEINDYIKRAENETIDSLYNRAKSLWKKYEDMENLHIVICAADTIFTYFQDRLGLTHYLLFVGDNNVGKTNNLRVFQQLGYRALCDVSITPANICSHALDVCTYRLIQRSNS